MNKKVLLISLSGLLVIGAAYGVRAYLFRTKYALSIALDNPQVKKLTAQAEALQAARDANPNDVNARWKLADFYQKINRPDMAAPELDAIIKLEPKNEDALIARANVQLFMRQAAEAEQTFRTVTELYPKKPAGWQGLASALFLEHRFFESMSAAKTATELEPTNPNNRFIMATAILQYANQFPDAPAYASYVERARIELERLLKVWPEPADIQFRLGSAYALLRDHKKAIENFELAHQAKPDRAEIVVEMAKSHIALGDRPVARKVVEEALSHKVQSADLYDLDGQLIQGSVEPDANMKALKAFETACKLAPKQPLFLERYGSACIRVNKLAEARKAFEDSAMMNPNRAFPFQQLAAIYTRQGEVEHAAIAAKQAQRMVHNDQQLRQIQLLAQQYPNDINLHLILAERYRDLNLRGPAWDKYILVQRLDPNNKKAREGLEALRREMSNKSTASAQSG